MEHCWTVKKLKNAAAIGMFVYQARFLCPTGTEMKSSFRYKKYGIICIIQVAKK